MISRYTAQPPSTAWTVQVPEGELSWCLPANAIIDLKRKHVITKVISSTVTDAGWPAGIRPTS